MMQFPYLFKLTCFKINIICNESVSFLKNDIINNYVLSNGLHQELIMFSWLHFMRKCPRFIPSTVFG